MSKRLSSLTDQELSDVLTSSVMAYSIYLEEQLEFSEMLLSSKLLAKNKIQDEWFKYSRIQEFQNINSEDPMVLDKIADHLTDFTDEFLRKNKEIFDDYINEKKEMYKIHFKEISKNHPEEFDKMVEKDAKTIIQREVFKYFKGVLNAPGLTDLNREKECKRILLEEYDCKIGGTCLEEKYIDKVIFNQVKASYIAQQGYKSLRNIKPNFMGLEPEGTIKTVGGDELEYTIKNGIVEIGTPGKEKDTSFLVSFYRNNDKPELHISFRGTEPNAKSVAKYGAYDYQNMERHYKNMEPIIEKLVGAINRTFEKSGNTLEVRISGHSLGGAMVEKFMEKHPDTNNVKYKAFTFGSPGGIHKAQKLVNKIDSIADFTANNLGLEKTAKYGRFIASTATTLTVGVTSIVLRCGHFFKASKNLLTTMFPYKPEDKRIMSLRHVGDIVPKAGSILYKRPEEQILLSNKNQDEAVKDHKMYNYMNEIIQEIVKRPTMYEDNKMLFALNKAFEETPYIKAAHQKQLVNHAMTMVNKKIASIRERLTADNSDDYNSFSKLKV